MNQVKTGEFLKQLRKKEGLTQEQLAEQFLFPAEPFHVGKQEKTCLI